MESLEARVRTPLGETRILMPQFMREKLYTGAERRDYSSVENYDVGNPSRKAPLSPFSRPSLCARALTNGPSFQRR